MTAKFQRTGKSDLNDRAHKNLGWGLLIVFLFVVIHLWVVTLGLSLLLTDSSEKRAHFGEMFGSVNSLFSGLAFAALIVTLYLQKEVLELQRQDLRNSQEQSRKQADQLEAQRQLVSKQNFEDTFFRMLDILRMQANEVTFTRPDRDKSLKGLDVFRELYRELDGCYREYEDDISVPDKIHFAILNLKHSNPELLNYLGTFVHTLSLLELSDVKDKDFYGTFLSTQLTPSEKLLLFY